MDLSGRLQLSENKVSRTISRKSIVHYLLSSIIHSGAFRFPQIEKSTDDSDLNHIIDRGWSNQTKAVTETKRTVWQSFWCGFKTS